VTRGTTLTPAQVHDAARLIYERVGGLLWRVPFDDIGTEREAAHRHVGSSKVTESLYQLARDLGPMLQYEDQP
jgi:hypothetical protein